MLRDSKKFDEQGKLDMDKAQSEEIKNKFDRRIYELDLYKSILSKIKDHDYRYPKTETDSELCDTSVELMTEVEKDELTSQSIRQLEVILNKKCKKCATIKAPQSHHCSICKRCVARMDHHCPWVNNCVGYYN